MPYKLYSALAKKENLVAPSVVFAELMPQFKGNAKQLGEFLEEHKIAIEPLDVDSAVSAAQAWMKYLKRKTRMECPLCGGKLDLKERFLSDVEVEFIWPSCRETSLMKHRLSLLFSRIVA